MNDVSPNLIFVQIMIAAFRKANRDKIVSAKEAIAWTCGDILSGKFPELNGMDTRLFKNFSDGYRNAIKKYGEETAAIRMEDYLIGILAKKTNMTKEDVTKKIDEALTFADMMCDGIHLTQDENGDYREGDTDVSE